MGDTFDNGNCAELTTRPIGFNCYEWVPGIYGNAESGTPYNAEFITYDINGGPYGIYDKTTSSSEVRKVFEKYLNYGGNHATPQYLQELGHSYRKYDVDITAIPSEKRCIRCSNNFVPDYSSNLNLTLGYSGRGTETAKVIIENSAVCDSEFADIREKAEQLLNENYP